MSALAAFHRYREIEEYLEEYLHNLTTLQNEVFVEAVISRKENIRWSTPHPTNAVAVLIITVQYTPDDPNDDTRYYYHCYLDDCGKRMTEFGSDGEIAERVDHWLEEY